MFLLEPHAPVQVLPDPYLTAGIIVMSGITTFVGLGLGLLVFGLAAAVKPVNNPVLEELLAFPFVAIFNFLPALVYAQWIAAQLVAK